eukprot:s1949_g11.t1
MVNLFTAFARVVPFDNTVATYWGQFSGIQFMSMALRMRRFNKDLPFQTLLLLCSLRNSSNVPTLIPPTFNHVEVDIYQGSFIFMWSTDSAVRIENNSSEAADCDSHLVEPCDIALMVVDVALGNIYGAVLGVTASVLAKTLSALLSLFIGGALGLEFPEILQKRMGAVQKRPLQAESLVFTRLAPISTGVKNYALALLPAEDLELRRCKAHRVSVAIPNAPEDVPLLPYTLAVLAANLLVTTGICILGAGADNLVDALDQVTGS